MKIYLTPCSPMLIYRIDQLHEWALLAQPQIHSFIDNPEESDIILIPDIIFVYTYQLDFLCKFLYKCYALDCSDVPNSIIPGLYASATQASLFAKYRLRGSCYLFNRHRRNIFLNSNKINYEKKYLTSFIGGATSWVRKRLFILNFQRNDILIECTTGKYNHWSNEQKNSEEYQKNYINTLLRSKFALCPRGIGSNSIRLFEVMELGIAPIIISDNWLPPQGPDWESFALFLKESEIKKIDKIAELYSSEYEERGRLARKAWEEFFSDSVCFNKCIEQIEILSQYRILFLDKFFLYAYPYLRWCHDLKWQIRDFLKFLLLSFLRILSIKFPYKIERN